MNFHLETKQVDNLQQHLLEGKSWQIQEGSPKTPNKSNNSLRTKLPETNVSWQAGICLAQGPLQSREQWQHNDHVKSSVTLFMRLDNSSEERFQNPVPDLAIAWWWKV